MPLSLRQWRPRHLLMSWVVYWVILIGIGLGRSLAAIARIIGKPDADGSTISAGVNDGVFTITVTDPSGAVVEQTLSVMSMVLWFAIPPLLIWAVWMALSRRAPQSAARDPVDADRQRV
jgi:hypothetical protein